MKYLLLTKRDLKSAPLLLASTKRENILKQSTLYEGFSCGEDEDSDRTLQVNGDCAATVRHETHKQIKVNCGKILTENVFKCRTISHEYFSIAE